MRPIHRSGRPAPGICQFGPPLRGGRLRDVTLPTTLPAGPQRPSPSGLGLRKLAVAALLALLAVAGLVGIGLLGIRLLALQANPSLPATEPITPLEVHRAMQLLQRHDPRGKLPGITRQVALADRDLSLLALYATKRLGEPRTRVQLHPGWAQLQASLALPEAATGGWLNIDLRLAERPGLPEIEQLRLGRLALPGWLVRPLLPPLVAALRLQPQAELVRRLVSQMHFQPGQLSVAYAWPDDLQRTLASGLMPAAEQSRVAVYRELLAQITAAPVAAALVVPVAQAGTHAGQAPRAASAPRELSMAQLLPPVFALARSRSADSATAVLENRAALTALALMVNTVPIAPQRPPPGAAAGRDPGFNVTLLGRQDTPLHFLISAALSAEGGAALADAVGLYKELSDSQGGSGFSFNDLAADRAGTRLGRLAVRDPLAFQARLAAGVQEDDLMPGVADLPEALTQPEFLRRFGGVGGVAYQRLLQDIEARLDRLALLAAGQ